MTVAEITAPCKRCGSDRPATTRCSHCGGHGLTYNGEGIVDCPDCNGGTIWPPRCPACYAFRKWGGWAAYIPRPVEEP